MERMLAAIVREMKSNVISVWATCGMTAMRAAAVALQIFLVGSVAKAGEFDAIDEYAGGSYVRIQNGCKIDADGWVVGVEDESVTAVEVPEGVLGIAKGAFNGVYDLEEVTLPSSVRYLARGAFENCTVLSTIRGTIGIERIGPRAFANCTSLAALSAFGEGVLQHIGDCAFSNCWRMVSIALPVTVESIESTAFTGCGNLTGVTVPTHTAAVTSWFQPVYRSLKYITVSPEETLVVSNMFKGCSALTRLTFPPSVESIGASALEGCSKLTEIDLSESLQTIGARAFAGCSALTAIVMPNTVQTVGAQAFSGCSSLSEIHLSDTLTALPESVFENCSKLKSFTVPASVRSLGSYFVPSATTAIYYLGNAPDCADYVYGNANGSLISYVKDGTRGWDGIPGSRDLPPSWNGRDIRAAIAYDVTFDANGGCFYTPVSNETYACEQMVDNKYALPPFNPLRSGYKFDGYWTEEINGSLIDAQTKVTLRQKHTLYAHWAQGTPVTIHFNPNGGTITPEEMVYTADEPYGSFPVATREYYDFVGWFTDRTGGDQVKNSTKAPKAETTLYAHWTPKRYIIRMHANNGTSAYYDQGYIYGQTITLHRNTFSLKDCQFAGWSLQPGAPAVYDDCDTLSTIANVEDGVMHLYARWSGNVYAVRYDQHGGYGRMSDQTFVVGVAQKLLPCTFTRTNFVFKGWATSATGPVVYSDGQEVVNLSTRQNDTVELWAVWDYSHEMCTITFDANGGTVSESSRSVASGMAMGELPEPNYPGRTFLGWFTEREGGEPITKDTVVPSPLNLYAHWSDQPYTITFDANGGTVSESSRDVEPGTAMGELPEPNYPGHTFLGWFTEREGGEPITKDTVVGSSMPLYAHWSEVMWTVTFDPNGGTCETESWAVAEGDTVSFLPQVSWTGYDFLGWFTAADGGAQVGLETQIITNMIWYAHWQAASSWEGTESIGGKTWGYRVENGEVTITSVPEGEGTCEIPASIQGRPTVRIGVWAFSGRRYSQISMPEGLKDIGEMAFNGCSLLSEIEFPNTVTNIGNYAFNANSGLKKVVIPESVLRVGDGAFDGCSNIEDLSILAPDMVCNTSSGSFFGGSFAGVKDLLRVTLPGRKFGLSLDSVTNIVIAPGTKDVEDYFANYCQNVESIDIPEGVTNIGDYAFCNCSSLSRIRLPESLRAIGDWAFDSCTGLSEIDLPDSLESIGGAAFSGSALKSITLPNGIKELDYTFESCTHLESVVLLSGLETIGFATFRNCSQLRQVTLPEGLKCIGNDAFRECSSLESIVIPDAVEIGFGVFDGCASLKSMRLGRGVFFYGSAFYGCNNLTKVTMAQLIAIPEDERDPNPMYRYEYYGVQDIFGYDIASLISELELEEGVESIPENFLYGMYSLETLTLPSSIREIAFWQWNYSCPRLTFDTTTIPGLKLLSGIVIGYTSALPQKPNLTGVKGFIKAALSESKIVEATIPEGIKILPQDLFNSCIKLTSVTLPASLEVIGPVAFGRTALSEILIPAAVTNIGSAAFWECKNLTKVMLPATLKGSFDVDDVFQGMAEIPELVYYSVDCEATFDPNGGEAEFTERTYFCGRIFGELPSVTKEGAVFAGWRDETGNFVTANALVPDRARLHLTAQWGQNVAVHLFNAKGSQDVTRVSNGPYGDLPVLSDDQTPEEGFVFAGWTLQEGGTALVGPGDVVPEEGTTLYAVWIPGSLWPKDGDYAITMANVYDGYLTDADGQLVGTIQLKAGKGSTKNDVASASVSATVVDASGKKWSYTKGVANAKGVVEGLTCTAKGVLVNSFAVTLGANALNGTWGDASVDGARNGMTGKNDAMMAALDAHYKKSWSISITNAVGTTRLQLLVGAKGVVKISGTTADGLKLAASVQGVMGDGAFYVPYLAMVKNGKSTQPVRLLAKIAEDGLVALRDTNLGGLYAGGATTDKVTFAAYWESASPQGGETYQGMVVLDELCYPVKFSAKGLPSGMKIDAASGRIYGVPTKPGRYTVVVTAVSGVNAKAKQTVSYELVVGNFRSNFIPVENAYGPYHVGVKVFERIPESYGCSVSGLPSGLKYAAKEVKDSVFGVVPAGTIYGVPSKAGSFTIYFSKTVEVDEGTGKPMKLKCTASSFLDVAPLDTWAQGVFDGAPFDGETCDGLVQAFTVAAGGKISGKILADGFTWTLAASAYDSYDDSLGAYRATVVGKSGKLMMTNKVTVSVREVRRAGDAAPYQRGVVTGAPQPSASAEDNFPPEWQAWQNLWKSEPWKGSAKPFAKAKPLDVAFPEPSPSFLSATVTLKFAASGAVTATGKFVTGKDAKGGDVVYSATCSSVLIPGDDDGYTVFFHFPPKTGKFVGYSGSVALHWNGTSFQ